MNLQAASILTKNLKPTISRYVPDKIARGLSTKQTIFLCCKAKEAGYGGATGGGKSVALLVDALQNIHIPGYSAILFRKTFADLAKEGALMDMAHDWFTGIPGVKWNERDKKWIFPTHEKRTATISFGYIDSESDKYNYAGAAYQYCGFDEATHFSLSQYQFLFSRIRKEVGLGVPLKMRSATNPGGYGHEWYKERFLTLSARVAGRVFIHAGLKDNPNLDIAEYMEMLKELDPVTREMYINGNWDVAESAGMFDRAMFEGRTRKEIPKLVRVVRAWDTAATKPNSENPDPDWTVGAKVGVDIEGNYWILDIIRFRGDPAEVDRRMRLTAEKDGIGVKIWCEVEPGSGGKFLKDHIKKNTLQGFEVGFKKANRMTGSKIAKAKVFASAAGYGSVYMKDGLWIEPMISECEIFPMGVHDDQVDAISLAMQNLKKDTSDMYVGDDSIVSSGGSLYLDQWSQIKAEHRRKHGHTVGWNADEDEDIDEELTGDEDNPYTAASIARGRRYNFTGGH